MKPIKLLFSISLFLIFGSKIHSQVIREDATFLNYSVRFNFNYEARYLLNYQIYKGDYENLYYGQSSLFLVVNDKKVYLSNYKDTMLYFDYSLEVGDTFYFNGLSVFPKIEPIVVDSIKSIILNDGKQYKHWYVGGIYGLKVLVRNIRGGILMTLMEFQKIMIGLYRFVSMIH